MSVNTLHSTPDTQADPLPVVDALDPAHMVVAAAMQSTAAQVLALNLTPDDLPGYAAIWQTILDLANAGTNPCPVTVQGILARTGKADAHSHNRLVRCTTATVYPEQLTVYAETALTARYSDGFESLAVSLTAASNGPESDKERILATHRQQLLGIRARRDNLRGDAK